MTGRRVLFLQLEIFLNCPPHMGMCLFVRDLRRQGVDCTTYIVNCNHIEDLLHVINEGNFSLICIDSCFTVDMVNQITEAFPEIPLLVGGVNAIALFLHTKIPFAVFGPGRQAIKEFMAEFFGEKDFTRVTNLFFKEGNRIRYSGQTQHWDLAHELFPFEPHVTWQYLGPERTRNADTQALSIIAGTGCPYSQAVKSVVKHDVTGAMTLLGHEVGECAMERLEEIFNPKRHGCSFCIFQLQEHRAYSVEKTTELLFRQAKYLFDTHNTSAFHIQTENPFPFLNPFIERVIEQGIPLDFISIRTRPDTLLRQEALLLKALQKAKKNEFHFSIEEVGFESFVDEELVLFDKGIDKATNLKALGLLRRLKRSYGSRISVHVGHGIILFHPWTTLDSLIENVGVMAEYTDVFPRFYPLSLTLYSEFLPIFPKAVRHGEVALVDYAYGWDYEQRNPLVRKAFDLYQSLYENFGPDISIPAYLDAMRSLEDRSMEEILFTTFGTDHLNWDNTFSGLDHVRQ